jgi:hypothetical protein
MAEFKDKEYTFPDEQDDFVKDSSESEIEIEDDTPEEDRGRRPMKEPVEEVTDEELSSYDEKVQARIKKFTRGYHDERRAKEEAVRERHAAESYAKQIIDENKQLQQQLSQGSEVYIEQAKKVAEKDLEEAKRSYKQAFEDGDTDGVVAAQEQITRAVGRLDRTTQLRPLQVQEKELQTRQASPPVDQRAEQWRSDNEWFGKNRSMTAFALGLHSELVEDKGVDPTSGKYYQVIDRTMREKFPEHFGSDEEPAYEEESPRRATKPSTVVAPASRSTPPNRIRLKASEAAIARRLGVPLEEYAKQVAQLKRGE